MAYRDTIQCKTLFSRLRLTMCGLAASIVIAGAVPTLAADLTFTYGGDKPWFNQTAITHDGVDAQQCGAITSNQSSWMETTVTGPGAIRFWWKVSSEACCDPLQFNIDGTSQTNIRGEIGWQSKAYAIPAGSHTLRWTYSTDGSVFSGSNAGWVDQISFTPGDNFDVTPPITVVSPAGGTVSAPQTVTLSSNEAATIYFTTDGSEPSSSSSRYTTPITISSTTTLKFLAVDTAGNYELTKTTIYTFDTTPPDTYATLSAGTYSGARNVSLYCSDSGLGCSATYYCLGAGCTPATPYSSTIAITASTPLRYYSTDRAGNSEAVKTSTYTITMDTTPPTTTPGNKSGVYGPLYSYFYCSDGNGSGCAATYYCLGTSCTPTTLYSSSVYVSASTDVRFYSQDTSGNNETVQTVSYVIDTTPPVTTATPPGGSYETAPLVTLACSDGNNNSTGCSNTYYCLGENCFPNNQYTSPIAINDTKVLRFRSRDYAYNDETIVSQSYINPSLPKTINVPTMQATIQAAIDIAYNGDTVLVAPGTYLENINFKGKAITVVSSGGADVTVIDGNKTGSVVSFNNAETSSSVLDGFTIRNGSPSNGDGGGIYVYNASPTIRNNKITANTGSWGGGIYVGFGSPIIQNNVITSNHSNYYGGGIEIGGAASAQIIGNTISENSSESGAGISMWAAGTPLIKGNVVINNVSSSEGGGISIYNQSSSLIIQNLIANNKAATGGGVYSGNSTDSFVNNTIADNDSTQGSALSNPRGSFINNIIAGKSGQPAVYCNYYSTLNFKNNLVYSSGQTYTGSCTDQNGNNGNITADPRLSNSPLGYYGLQPGSPAIDAGDVTATSLPATDLGGMARIIDGNGDGTATVDIGAYEFDPARPVATLQGIPTDFLMANSLTITVGGTDVVSYRYAFDGGTFTSTDTAVATPINLTGLTNGQHSIVVLGKNALGIEQMLSSATAMTWVVNTETTDLIFTNGGAAPWFVQPLVSRDGIAYQSGAIGSSQSSWIETTVTGPGAIRFWWKTSPQYYSIPLTFSIDGTTQTSITGETDWQSNAFAIPSGSHILRWTYSDNSYSSSGAGTGWIDQITYEQGSSIDVTPPVTSTNPAAGMYGSSQSVALACGDSTGSGCSQTFYCLGSNCQPNIPYNGTITVSTATSLRFYSTDAAGNSENVKTATYTFDTTPPSTYNYLSAGTYSGMRNAELYCTDSGMGCNSTFYCLGTGCTPTTPYTSAIAITASTDLRYYSADRGGNSEVIKTVTYTITPDITPPITTAIYSSGTYRPMSVYLNCNDNSGSGCATTYYCLGTSCTPTTSFSSSVSITSSTDLRFYSVDRSGNSGAITTASYVIDNNAPTTTTNVGGGIYSTSQNITLSCSDGTGSGCSTIIYCLGKGCSPNTQYAGPISITSSTYLSYYSEDAVYNHENTRTERYTILTAPAATINVPADRTTIQAAIDAANDGDTVLVAPGTYVEHIDFKGKAISVTSSDGPDATTIDGNQTGPVVNFVSGEWLTSILDGFTLRNGKSGFDMPSFGYGGGVIIRNSSPTVRNNTINNNSGCVGIGVYVNAGSPLIQGNLIAHNTQVGCSTGEGGGGVYLGWAPGTQLIDNTISNNSVPGGSGGGIFSNGSGKALIRGNKILSNTAVGNGGGIAMVNTNEPDIIQNLITGNHAASGGGIYWSIPSSANGIKLESNTIAANDATQGGGVFAGGYDSNAMFINNIVSAKSGQSAIYCESGYDNLPPQLGNNIVFTPDGLAYSGICTDQNGINGNITADPQLNSAAFGYYGLRPGSPAIDAGDNGAPSLPATDLNGAARLMNGSGQGSARVDIGAYEFDPDAPRAVVSGSPTTATRETSASLTVGGQGIVSYRYAVDGGAFTSTDTPVATPITLTGLAGGTHAIAVIGTSSSGEQMVSSASVAEWTIDTAAPITAATPASGTFTTPQTVTLSCSDGSGSGCTATFYCLGGGCTPSTPYTGPIDVSATAGLRYYSRDAFDNQEEIKTASYTFTGTITGRVIDSGTGAGIQGVYVTTYNAITGSYLGNTYTDSTGNYQIAGLTSGSYKLRFIAGNYIEQWYNGRADRSTATSVAVSAPGATTDINVVMIKGGSISGSVTAKDTSAGIQSVQVEAYNATTGSLISSASCDNTGAYSISGLVAGEYKLRFSGQYGSGYLSQWYSDKTDLASAAAITVTNANITTGINVSLQKGGSITGTVTDSTTGAPIQNVYVTAVGANAGNWIYSGYTDSSGVYSFTGLSGSYKLRFSATNYVDRWYGGTSDQTTAATVAVTAPGTTAGINMAMVKGANITGSVIDSATGTAISGAYVLTYNATTSLSVSSAYTDSSGAYSIPGLATGTYKLRFYASGYVERWSGGTADQSSAATVAVTAPSTTAGINMGLIKGAIISGTVTDKETGAAIQGVSVNVYNSDTGFSVGHGYTDSSGAYRISGLASGSYKLQFQYYSNSGYLVQWYGNKDKISTATTVEVSAPNTVNGINAVLEKGGAISGTVTDKDTGNAIYGVLVSAYNTATGSWAGSDNSDSFGSYNISGLATGSYKLVFSASGYLKQWSGGTADEASASTITTTAPNTTANIDMALNKGGNISGTISDRTTGVGIAWVNLSVFDHATGNQVGLGQTDSYGNYTISGLGSGSFRLRIEPAAGSGYLEGWYGDKDTYLCAETISVAAPHTTTGIDATLAMGGSFSGRVTDSATGLAIPGAYIALTDSSTNKGMYFPNTPVDSSGAYTISGVPSGDYSLTFSAHDYIRANYSAVVRISAPNLASGVDVSLARGGGISGRVTDNGTGEGIGNVEVVAMSATSGTLFAATTSSTGDYAITGLPGDSYALYFDGSYGSGSYATDWYVPHSSGSTSKSVALTAIDISAGSFASDTIDTPAPPVSPLPPVSSTHAFRRPVTLPASYPVLVTAPATTAGMNLSIAPAGTITGLVTDRISNEALRGISATAFDSITGLWAGSAFSNSDGVYSINGLPGGSYRIQFSSSPVLGANYLGTWYGNSTASTVAAEVPVRARETTSGIDANLAKGGSISGFVSVSNCPGPRQVSIMAYDAASGNLAGQTRIYTNNSNRFTIGALPAGNYKLAIDPGEAGFVRQWYPGKTEETSAEPVTVTAGNITDGITATLTAGGGSISGTVSSSACRPHSGSVKVYDWYSGGLVAENKTAADGSYLVTGLPDASYKLLFSINHVDRWYADGNITPASPIVISGGSSITGIDLTPACSADGDLDGNGGANLSDALKALRIALDLDTATPEFLAHGDLAPVIDGVSTPDGKIDIADALLILQKIVSTP